MDCNMPLMNGYDATRILLDKISSKQISPITIIACTADITEKNINRCRNVGFHGIVLKPVGIDKLKDLLQ